MEEEVSELDIVILSPWYRSWWAWILYALLLGILITGRGKIARMIKAFGKWRQERRKKADDTATATPDKEEEIEEAVLMDE